LNAQLPRGTTSWQLSFGAFNCALPSPCAPRQALCAACLPRNGSPGARPQLKERRLAGQPAEVTAVSTTTRRALAKRRRTLLAQRVQRPMRVGRPEVGDHPGHHVISKWRYREVGRQVCSSTWTTIQRQVQLDPDTTTSSSLRIFRPAPADCRARETRIAAAENAVHPGKR
jgi:hypothetical protein